MKKVDTSKTDISNIPLGSHLQILDDWGEVNITVMKKTGITVTFATEETGLLTVMNYRNFNRRYQIIFDHGVVSDYTLNRLRERYKSIM